MKIRTRTNWLIVFSPLIMIPIILLLEEDVTELVIALAVIILVSALMAFATVKNYYLLEDKDLVYVMWFWKKRIPYEAISKGEISYNPLSSPAMTIRRLEISGWDWSQYLFSLPAKRDQATFKAELERRCPKANIDFSRIE